jgi:hypothetical protein
MHITQVSYGKTINIGNYQSIRVEFTADIRVDESPKLALNELKRILEAAEVEIREANSPKVPR